MNTLFPIFIKADEIKILVIGGGEVALEKLHFLLKSSPKANIRIVAEEFNDEVIEKVRFKPNIRVAQRSFREEDLKSVHLVIAATNNEKFNLKLKRLCAYHKVLLNVADKAEQCDFYLGGIVTKGDLKIAISTNGKSPILAKRLRQFLENEIPDSFDSAISLTEKLRKKLNGPFERKVKELNNITSRLVSNDE